jgi:hypothetical protein
MKNLEQNYSKTYINKNGKIISNCIWNWIAIKYFGCISFNIKKYYFIDKLMTFTSIN